MQQNCSGSLQKIPSKLIHLFHSFRILKLNLLYLESRRTQSLLFVMYRETNQRNLWPLPALVTKFTLEISSNRGLGDF